MWNDGAGNFTVDDTWLADGEPLPAATAAYLLDLDADGDLDAWLGKSRDGLDRFLFQESPGNFRSLILEGSETGSFAAAFGDLDGDQDLDLLVTSRPWEVYSEQFVDGSLRGEPNHLYLQGPEGWTRADERLPVAENRGVTFHAPLLDVDGDGDLDVYSANDGGYQVVPNQLWLNDGNANFTMATDCACDRPMYAMGASFSDWNEDQLPDIYVSNIGPQLYLMSDTPGTFVDMTLASGALIPQEPEHMSSWGISTTDFDRDAFDDLFVTFGRSESDIESIFGTLPGTDPAWVDADLQHNVLVRGAPEGQFVVEQSVGLEAGMGRFRGVMVGDLDGDGDPDAVVTGKHDYTIWKTSGGCETGIQLTIAGPPHNPHGIGTRVSVDVLGTGTHLQTRWMLPGRFHGNDAHELIFGLAGLPEAARIELRFPDGTVQTLEGVPAGPLPVSWAP